MKAGMLATCAAAAFTLFSTTVLPGATAAETGAFSPAQKQDIEKVVRDYILANPEIIREAIAALQKKQAEAEEARRADVLKNSGETLVNSPYQVVLGNPQGDVTLVEFFDYNCGYCRQAHADIKQLVATDPALRLVLKQFPVLGQGSSEAAQVAIAVAAVAPDKYSAFHDKMLTDRAQANGNRAVAVATALGIDAAKLRAAMSGDLITRTLEEVDGLAGALGISGTPSYVLGNEVVVGAVGYDALKAKIEAVRKCGVTTC